MHPARKRRIWLARGGLCDRCKEPCDISKGTIYDHVISLWMQGPDTDENVVLHHADCDKAKTRADAKARAKVKRLLRGPKKGKRKILSRGFDKRLRKRMDGTVERR